MKRLLFNLTAGLSLIVAVFGMWLSLGHGRGSFVVVRPSWRAPQREFALQFRTDGVMISRWMHPPFVGVRIGGAPPYRELPGHVSVVPSGDVGLEPVLHHSALGIKWMAGQPSAALFGSWLPSDRLLVPYWIIVLVGAPVPLLWCRAYRRRREWLKGRCAKCGYDLRGSPAGGACPECGAARAAASEAPKTD